MSLKGVIFSKIWISKFLGFFWIFPEFILIFKSLRKWQKGGLYLHRTAELMLRVGPARMRHGMQGHMAAPRGPTREGGVDTWQGHASPRGRQGGATWQHEGGWHVKGPWVSGPWLDNWGGNANALRRPTLYTHHFSQFFPYGTMFP